MQQGLAYAELLDVPFVFSSNGDGFVFHDRLASGGTVETEFGLDEFHPYSPNPNAIANVNTPAFRRQAVKSWSIDLVSGEPPAHGTTGYDGIGRQRLALAIFVRRGKPCQVG